MSLWEYKVITSGKGGFATPALLEKFLNDLGRDEWEIVEFRSAPDNVLAFTGLARRSTQRDWTLQDAAAAAAKAEAEKLRAEFAAKFQAATSPVASAEEKSPSFLEEKTAPDDGFRKPVDTSRDGEPEAPEDDHADKDEWDELAGEDELPSFFDALKPHMRRNQRGPGMSVGTDYLAKKWGLDESDVKGALVECGLQIPADENAKPVHIEYDGDLYWVNINRRGEVWINTREKPRPIFRVVQGTKVESTEEPKSEEAAPKAEERTREQPNERRRQENRERAPQPEKETAKAEAPVVSAETPATPPPAAAATNGSNGATLPSGPALLNKIRPLMRRNRRGPGGSGSASFLARAFKCSEADLTNSFVALGLVVPATAADAPVNVEIDGDVWWLNKDSRGGLWINGREKRAGEDLKAPSAAASAPTESSAATDSTAPAATPAPVEATPLADSAATETPATPTAASEPANPVSIEPISAVAPERPLETPAAPSTTAPTESVAPASVPATVAVEGGAVLAAVRLLLQETKTGGFAGKVERVATDLNKSAEDLTAALVAAGLKLPEKPREKPVFVEHAGEIFWFNRNAKGELWVNAKASKFADDDEGGATDGEGGRRPARRGGGRGKKPDEPTAV